MAKELRDNVSRIKRFNRLGVFSFVGLRCADFVLKYVQLRWGWGAKLIGIVGGHPLTPDQVFNSSTGHLLPYLL